MRLYLIRYSDEKQKLYEHISLTPNYIQYDSIKNVQKTKDRIETHLIGQLAEKKVKRFISEINKDRKKFN